MTKTINTILGTFDYNDYPIIRFSLKESTKPASKPELDDFLIKLKTVVNLTEGPFVMLFNTTHLKWVKAENRDYFGTSIQIFESEHSDRHKGNYVYVPNVTSYLFTKFLEGFITTRVPVITSFKMGTLEKKAKARIEKFKTNKA